MGKVVEEPRWYCPITLSWSFYLTKFYLTEYVWNNGQKRANNESFRWSRQEAPKIEELQRRFNPRYLDNIELLHYVIENIYF